MTRRSQLIALLFAVVFLPQAASANAGTPLMWAGMLHLVFGNALLGLGEGLLVALAFRRPKLRSVGLMIAANYLSAWLGGVALAGAVAAMLDWNLYSAWTLFWFFVGATFLVTLLLEWPLVALCFWRQERWFTRSVKAALLVQTVSYALLFAWYWGASGKSLYTRMEVVPVSEIKLPSNLELYYIAAANGRVKQGQREFGSVISSNKNDRLIIRELPGRTNAWTLLLRLDARRDEEVRLVTVIREVIGAMAGVEPTKDHVENGRETWFNFGPAVRIGTNQQSGWSFETGFWPIEGMTAVNEATGQKFHFAWETLFSQWTARNAIQLPDDHVVFQLGENQICVMEPNTRRVALFARGRGPAAALK